MKLRKAYILAAFVSILCVSCDSWLDTKPKDGLDGKEVLATLDGCDALLIGAYDDLQELEYYGRNMICIPEVFADNCGLIAGGTVLTNAYHNKIEAGCNIWVQAYKIVSIANDILGTIDNIEVSQEEKSKRDRIKGEALFFRGLAYFDLMRSYAREPNHLVNNFDLGVPYIIDAFVSQGKNLPPSAFPERAKITRIWPLIENDLDQAFTLLQGNDTDNFPRRANSYAAKSLLARVYLYEEKWVEAAKAADWVIKSGKIDLHAGAYEDIYIKEKGVESIFELYYDKSEALGSSSLHSIYGRMDDGARDNNGYGNDKGVGYGELIVGNTIRGMFEAGDKRTSMMRKVLSNNVEVWWTTKFNSWQGAYGQDNVPIIRIAELYLIRSEASLNLASPEYSTARADINKIRNTRGLGDTPEPDSKLMNALQKERRLELCFEGHRFFDLKRQGKDIPKEGGQATISYEDFRLVATIPQTELDVNKNLQNNPGY